MRSRERRHANVALQPIPPLSELTLQAARRIDPKRVALVLAGIWAVFAIVGTIVDTGHGTWTLQAFKLADSDLDQRLSMPASFTALLLGCSAGMAFALARVDRTRRERKWRLAGWALLALGLEQLLGIHSWLESRDVSWTISYLPLIALATVALLGAMTILRSQVKVQAMFGAAILLWLVGAVLDKPDLIASNVGPEIIEMASGTLFALSLLARLRYLAARYYPLEEIRTRLSVDQIAAEVLERVRFRPILSGIVVVTAAFGIQDAFLHTGNYHGHQVPILDINTEQTLWATFQGSLIFAVAGLALLISRLRATPAHMRRWWQVLGGVLLVLGTDEIVAIHDRFQETTGHPGQIVLLPVAIIGVVAWWKVLQEIRVERRVRTLFIAGAALWFLSQAVDVVFQEHFRWTIVPEEMLETLGTTCWLFSLGYWLRSVLSVGLFFPLDPVAGIVTRRRITGEQPAEAEQAPAPTG
jgi:hypothetical protein